MDIEKSAEDWKKEGNACYSAKEYSKAIDCYTQAIHLNPNDHTFYSNRASSYYYKNDFLSCIADCDACLNLKPTFTKAMRRKGAACNQLLKFGESIAAFRSALELEKDQAIKN